MVKRFFRLDPRPLLATCENENASSFFFLLSSRRTTTRLLCLAPARCVLFRFFGAEPPVINLALLVREILFSGQESFSGFLGFCFSFLQSLVLITKCRLRCGLLFQESSLVASSQLLF